MPAPKRTLYEILGAPPDANEIDIGLAYDRRRAELERAVPHDASELALVHEAYDVLSNPQRRAAYDASLVTAAEKAEAAQQAHEPDLLLEAEEPRSPGRRIGWVLIGAGAVALIAATYFALRQPAPPPPAHREVAQAPSPPPAPPPEAPRTPAEILKAALPSVGRVLSYEMSGNVAPIGLAFSIEPGVMVTTCHGIPAGGQIVVRIGEESHPATLTMTDEELDLCKLEVSGFDARALAVEPREPKPGDMLYVLGANAAGALALTEAKLEQLRPVAAGRVLELSVPIAPNGTGGAVFDRLGKLVAIAITPHGFGAGLKIALPAAWIAQMRSRSAKQPG